MTATVRRTALGGTPVVHALLDTLVTWGVDRIFCCPGSTEAALLDALVVRDDVELVLVTHESVAVAAAEGQARLTGRPSVAYLHTHVGMANAVAHLVSAQHAHAPVIVLNGLKPASLAGRGGFTTATHPTDLVRQHVKWAWQSVRTEDVPGDLDRSMHAAVAEPAGPVWLGLPQDLLESPSPATPVATTRTAERTRPSADAVAAAADAFRGARRPVLVAGSEVARQGASAELVRLAERTGALVVHEDRRDFQRSAFFSTHPHYAGLYRADLDADLVFFAGARLFTEFDLPDGAPVFPPGATVLHAHADAAEVGRLYTVDVGLVGHLRETISDLLAALGSGAVEPSPVEKRPAGPPPAGRAAPDNALTGPPRANPAMAASLATTPSHPSPDTAPVDRANATDTNQQTFPTTPNHPSPDTTPSGRANTTATSRPTLPTTPSPTFPGHGRLGPVVAAIAEGLDLNATVVMDATTASAPLLNALPHRPNSIHSSTSGSLGWGMGAALGASIARPGTPVVALLGDGVFQFGLPALWTAARHRLPVTFVVLNNRAYGAVASALNRFGGAATERNTWPGTDIAGPDLAAIATGFGLTTHRVDGATGLADTLRAAQASPDPEFIEVATS